MLSYEEFESLVNKIKDSLDETSQALISEDLLNVISNYKLGVDEISKLNEEVETLKKDKDELLKVNGKLFQKIGFDKEDDESEEKLEESEEIIDIEDVIDEKGELI